MRIVASGLRVHVVLLLTIWTLLCLSGSGSGDQSEGETPSGFWARLRAIENALSKRVDSVDEPIPSYPEIAGAWSERLEQACNYRVAGKEDAADSAFADCNLAARVVARFYQTDLLANYLSWTKTIPTVQIHKKLRSDSLFDAGVAEVRAANYDSAKTIFQRVRSLYDEIGDRYGFARAEFWLLTPSLSDKEGDSWFQAMSKVAEVASADGDLLLLAKALPRLASYEENEGRPESALVLYERYRELGERTKDPATVSRAWRNIGYCQLDLKNFDQSRGAFQKSLSISLAKRDTLGLTRAYDGLSSFYYRTDKLDSAVTCQRKVLEFSEQLDRKRGIAIASFNLCLYLWYLQELEEALQYCECSLQAARDTGEWQLEEYTLNILANIYNDNGKPLEALPRYYRALSLASAHDDFVMQCYILSNIGVGLAGLDSLTQARPYFERSLAIFDSIPSHLQNEWDLKGLPLLHLSALAFSRGDTSESLRLARESYDLAESANDRNLGHSMAGPQLGYLLLTAGDLKEAESVYRQAVEAAAILGNKRELWCGHAGLARVAWMSGERVRALEELDRAIEAIEAYREAMGSLGFRERWFASKLWAFETMIQYRIEEGDKDQAFSYYERMKARELLDVLAGGHIVFADELTINERTEEERLIAQIEDLNRRISGGDLGLEDELEAARDEYEAYEEKLFRLYPGLREKRGRGRPITASEARRMLAPDEVVLMYGMGPDVPTLLVVTREGVEGRTLESPTETIRRRIRSFTESIRQRGSWTALKRGGQELYAMLIAPAQELITDKHRICFVPDAELYAVPFQALVNPETESYLVEQYSTYITPSLSTLLSLRMKGSRGRRDLLAMGNPDFATAEPPAVSLRGSLAPLPFSGAEVTAVSEIYSPRAKVLMGSEATESAFKAFASGYGVIHLASHGLLDDTDPLYSSIAFSKKDDENDGFLEAREVAKLRLDADIVILSACETAKGAVTRGEGINGLLRSFFIAGVPTVVASLWPVEDESTALLMTEFHRHLRDGEKPADALAAAQRRMLRGDRGLRHPYFWASFLLYGDSE